MLDHARVAFEPVDQSAEAFMVLARKVETLDTSWSDFQLQAVNIDVLRIHTGEPFYPVKGQEAVTWDEFGYGAPGNPVYAMPRYLSDLSEASPLVPEDARLTLELGEDREMWTGTVRLAFENPAAPPTVRPMTVYHDEVPRMVTALGLHARARLAVHSAGEGRPA